MSNASPIHPTSVVSPEARLGEGVEIGAFTIVHDNVQIGSGTKIASHCSIGEPTALADGRPLIIGENSIVRSHAVMYEGSTIGPQLETGHHVSIRENLAIGTNFRLGTLSDLQGDASIGDYVRIHGNVQVGKLSVIEDFVWIFPMSVLTNDPHPPSDTAMAGVVVKRFAVIAASCFVAPGVTIGEDSVVAAFSAVTADVAPGTLVSGQPAKKVARASLMIMRDGSGRAAYPWRRHFTRGYPDSVVEAWRSENA